MKKKLLISEIHVVTVLEKRSPYTLISHYEAAAPNKEEIQKQLQKFVGKQGKQVLLHVLEDYSVSQAIEKIVKKKNIDMVFVSSHGYGASLSLLLGSTTQKLISKLKHPLTIIR